MHPDPMQVLDSIDGGLGHIFGDGDLVPHSTFPLAGAASTPGHTILIMIFVHLYGIVLPH